MKVVDNNTGKELKVGDTVLITYMMYRNCPALAFTTIKQIRIGSGVARKEIVLSNRKRIAVSESYKDPSVLAADDSRLYLAEKLPDGNYKVITS